MTTKNSRWSVVVVVLCCLVGWLPGSLCLLVRLVGCSFGLVWLVGLACALDRSCLCWLAGWLVDCLVACLFAYLLSCACLACLVLFVRFILCLLLQFVAAVVLLFLPLFVLQLSLPWRRANIIAVDAVFLARVVK